MIEINVSLERLKIFVLSAKRCTYAGDDKPKTTNNIKVYRFEEDNLCYEDRYVGNILDTGMEIVIQSNCPIWSMIYRGGVNSDSMDISRRTFEFLRESLQNVPKEFPVRGPTRFKRGNWVYTNVIEGDFGEFFGMEKIYLENINIYNKEYSGGYIFDKHHKMIIVD